MSNPFDQNLFSPAVVTMLQEQALDAIFREPSPPFTPFYQLLKPWQDVDTSGDETVYPQVQQ